ncbi:MAG: YigZ family protein [Desulfobacteraceae bacterium]|nr:MAG: YigZ family protein [Desulfobacteraceae bacterium]
MEHIVFNTITHPREVRLKIKRSDFICRLAHVETIEEAKTFISGISKENKTANHNCWAYIVGGKGEISHCSDAGEPAGTAGKPMLNMLQSHDMTQVAAVVTRFFGGVKLGVRGLIEAYGDTVRQTIETAPLHRLIATRQLFIQVPYPFNDTLLHKLSQFKGRVVDTQYAEQISHSYIVEDPDISGAVALLESLASAGKLVLKSS